MPPSPKMSPISSFGKVMDWNCSPWTRLCPFYTILRPFPGLEIDRTIPSVKPNQLFGEDPIEEHLDLVHPYSTLLWEESGCHKWNSWLHLQLNFKQKLALENVENRIAESAGVTCSSEQHTKSFQTITNASLFAKKHCRNLEGICKARKVCLFNLAEILPCGQLNSCFLDPKQPKSGVFER